MICWTSVAPEFQSRFAVEYSSYFISVLNLDLYLRCFDSMMSRGLHTDLTTFMCI